MSYKDEILLQLNEAKIEVDNLSQKTTSYGANSSRYEDLVFNLKRAIQRVEREKYFTAKGNITTTIRKIDKIKPQKDNDANRIIRAQVNLNAARELILKGDSAYGYDSRLDRLNVAGPKGGFLKRNIVNSGTLRYSLDGLVMNMSKTQRKFVFEAWSGYHLPLLLRNSKVLPGWARGLAVFDHSENPELVHTVLTEAREHDVRPILICASDKDWRENGGFNMVMRQLNVGWNEWGHMISGLIPRIEMDEDDERHSDWEYWGHRIREVVGNDPAVWGHFGQDMWFDPGSNYDGILYQHKRAGHDPSDRRSGWHHYSELVDRHIYSGGIQDRTAVSPIISAQDHNMVYVSFEFAQLLDDTQESHDDILEGTDNSQGKGIKHAFQELGEPLRFC